MKRPLFFLVFLFTLILWALPTSGQGSLTSKGEQFFYTHHQPSGNRIVEGSSTVPNVARIDNTLDALPAWVIASFMPRGSYPPETAVSIEWVVSFVNDDRLLSVNTKRQLTLTSETIPINAPFLVWTETGARLVPQIIAEEQSPFTHQIRFGKGWLYVASDSDLVFYQNPIRIYPPVRLPLNTLPDARLVVNHGLFVALYINATDRYNHNILGDSLEGGSLVVLEAGVTTLTEIMRVDLPTDEVFEGISPFWADVDEDGTEDLVTTVSSAESGSRIRVYRSDGTTLAEGDPVGEGYQWRHQLAFGAFGPNGENELVAVRTPETDGVVEFYRLNGDHLDIVAELSGYSSHQNNSRNLDMAVGGDFNGDGQMEIVVPDQSYTRLAGIQHSADGTAEIWSLPLDGRLTTNLSAVTLLDGKLALAAGTDTNTLRIWLPE